MEGKWGKLLDRYTKEVLNEPDKPDPNKEAELQRLRVLATTSHNERGEPYDESVQPYGAQVLSTGSRSIRDNTTDGTKRPKE